MCLILTGGRFSFQHESWVGMLGGLDGHKEFLTFEYGISLDLRSGFGFDFDFDGCGCSAIWDGNAVGGAGEEHGVGSFDLDDGMKMYY